MDIPALREWLSQPRTALVAAVTEGVRDHVAALRASRTDFYGYALLPGEPYDIHSLVVVVNGETDIKVSTDDDQYGYHRYSVDEWAHWYRHELAAANKLLIEANEQFRSMYTKPDDEYTMDEYEIAHADALLEAVVRGLDNAKQTGIFGSLEPFLVVWISDSDHPIITESVQQLNSETVIDEFTAEFG